MAREDEPEPADTVVDHFPVASHEAWEERRQVLQHLDRAMAERWRIANGHRGAIFEPSLRAAADAIEAMIREIREGAHW